MRRAWPHAGLFLRRARESPSGAEVFAEDLAGSGWLLSGCTGLMIQLASQKTQVGDDEAQYGLLDGALAGV